MGLDVGEFTPAVDGWFKLKKTFTIKDTGVYMKLTTGNIDLFFKKETDGTLTYDGWGCDVRGMGLVIPQPPHDENYDENKPGT